LLLDEALEHLIAHLVTGGARAWPSATTTSSYLTITLLLYTLVVVYTCYAAAADKTVCKYHLCAVTTSKMLFFWRIETRQEALRLSGIRTGIKFEQVGLLCDEKPSDVLGRRRHLTLAILIRGFGALMMVVGVGVGDLRL